MTMVWTHRSAYFFPLCQVIPSPEPNKWNLVRIVGVATTMGITACAGCLIFLALVRDNAFGLATYVPLASKKKREKRKKKEEL